MQRKWLSPRLVLWTGLSAGLVAVLALGAGRLAAQPPPPPGGAAPMPTGAGDLLPRAIGPLNQAYDGIAMVSVWMSSGQAKLDRDDARLLDHAKDFYRSAHRAHEGGQDRRATELAVAADEAARGLLFVLSAESPKVEGIPSPPSPTERGAAPPPRERPPAPPVGGATPPPPPPAGPDAGRSTSLGVRSMIREVRDQVEDAAADGQRGPGQEFLDASRRALDQAEKQAEGGHYRRAVHFALAAEAWSHVGESLRHANAGGDRRDRPDGSPAPREAPPPVRDRGTEQPPLAR